MYEQYYCSRCYKSVPKNTTICPYCQSRLSGTVSLSKGDIKKIKAKRKEDYLKYLEREKKTEAWNKQQKEKAKRIRNKRKKIRKYSEKKNIEKLIIMLDDKEDSVVRKEVVTELKLKKDLRAVEPLIRVLLQDEDPKVRNEATEALWYIKDPRAVEPLIKALKDEVPEVRFGAVHALEYLGDQRAVEPLINALQDKAIVGNRYYRGTPIKYVVAISLGRLGNPQAIGPLIENIKDWSESDRSGAFEALKKITEKDFGKDYEKWQNWWEENKEKFIKKI